ncbi:MAG TPA: hypothetical protein GXZ27_00085 [Thermoanaerobacterales bacterium]|nr:hypothetical protein [Thermoanaerobacterales bacterium]
MQEKRRLRWLHYALRRPRRMSVIAIALVLACNPRLPMWQLPPLEKYFPNILLPTSTFDRRVKKVERIGVL